MTRWLTALVAALLLALLPGLPLQAAGGVTPESAPQGMPTARSAGSFQVAPVRILGVPALVVASPQLPGEGSVVDADRRAELIEGNLRLLYEPHSLCTLSEQLSEQLLEQVVLHGPVRQRLCNGDRWGLLGRPQDLTVVATPVAGDAVELQAQLAGRSRPIPLLTVTDADARLHGLSTEELAADWRELLERRLRHARRVMQPDQLELRIRSTVIGELVFGAGTAACLWVWTRTRRDLRQHQRQARDTNELQAWRPRRLRRISQLLAMLVLVQLVVMVGLALAAVPGRIPLAVAVLMQPLVVMVKAAAVAGVVWLLRQLLHFLLGNWLNNLKVPLEQRARREQRYRNLLQAGRRLLNLAGLIVLAAVVLMGLPGLDQTPVATWLAGGAVIGALALVFQGLLRDFVAGLVVLFDDHYAVGDFVEIDGLGGDVEDVGVLATKLRTLDQRVVVMPNSRCDRLINHTKLRSGVELSLPLDPARPQLQRALPVLRQECEAFACDPDWGPQLLSPPQLRGVKRVTPLMVELSILVLTRTGRQWAVERALLERLVSRMEREGLPLAAAQTASGGG